MRDEQSVPENRLDGNVLAGPLSEVFAVDVTMAGVTCVACGKAQRLAALEVYGLGPGLTARCTGCHGVILRVARVRDQVHLDVRGTVSLRFEL